MLNNKRNLFAINAIKFMEIINHSFIMLKLILLSINANIVLEAWKHPVVSNITWLCTPELQHSIAANVAKRLLLGINWCYIKNPGIRTNDLMHVNGVVKDSCWLTNWPNIDEEFTRVKNHLNATCAINGLLIQGMFYFYND